MAAPGTLTKTADRPTHGPLHLHPAYLQYDLYGDGELTDHLARYEFPLGDGGESAAIHSMASAVGCGFFASALVTVHRP